MSSRYPGMSDERRNEIIQEVRELSERLGRLYTESERAYGKTRLRNAGVRITKAQGMIFWFRAALEDVHK